jgi:alpha-L-rhamnosidase
VWEAARYTIELTTQGVIVDVANREVGAWSGDCEPAKMAIYYLAGTDSITATCLRNIAYSRALNGRLMGEWPSGVNGERFEAGIMSPPGSFGTEFPHHVFQWISAIWRHFVFSGDLALLDELFEPALRYLEQWVTQFTDEGGVLVRDRWDDMWDWVDWSGIVESMAPMNFFYYGALHDLHRAAQALGREDARRALGRRLSTLRAGLLDRFWSDEHGVFVDSFGTAGRGTAQPFASEHTLSLALRYDLVPRDHVSGVLDLLTSGALPDASPLHKVQKYWALGEHGRADAILGEVREKWMAMRSIEATGTCQESWEFDPDGGTAHCHAAATAPVHVLMAYVLGVRPTRAGFEEFIVHPDPGDLAYARGVVPTPYGDIRVSWDTQDVPMRLTVTPPDGFGLSEEGASGGRVFRRYRRLA